MPNTANVDLIKIKVTTLITEIQITAPKQFIYRTMTFKYNYNYFTNTNYLLIKTLNFFLLFSSFYLKLKYNLCSAKSHRTHKNSRPANKLGFFQVHTNIPRALREVPIEIT